jgi:hypothetical protein
LRKIERIAAIADTAKDPDLGLTAEAIERDEEIISSVP